LKKILQESYKKLMIEHKVFIIFTLLFLTAIFALENFNQRFWLHDFKVYYLAAKALVEGTPVYGVAFGLSTGFYKYSPFTLLLFTPSLLFDFYTAIVIQFFVITITTVVTFLLIQKIINSYLLNTTLLNINIVLLIALLCVFRHLFRELHLGNLNMIIVCLLSLGLLFTLKSKYILSGIFIGMVVLIKPYFLLLMLPFLIYGKVKTIVSTGLTVIISIIVSFGILGFTKGLSLYQEWLNSMIAHGTYLVSYETIFSLLKSYLFPNIPNIFQVVIILLVTILYLLFFLQLKKEANNNQNKVELNNKSFIIGFFILLSIIPNLLLTDTEHFLFTLPLILYIMNNLFINKNKVEITVFVIFILLYAAFSSDILGNVFTDKIDSLGMLGLGNLCLIGFSLYLLFKNQNTLINNKQIQKKAIENS